MQFVIFCMNAEMKESYILPNFSIVILRNEENNTMWEII